MGRLLFAALVILSFAFQSEAQHSVARQWNEVLLECIRNDFARPTVHARNLFHISSAMYDAWAVYDKESTTYFLGKEYQGFFIPYTGIAAQGNIEDARAETMSYAVYRLLKHRFANSPGFDKTEPLMSGLMEELGYDPGYSDTAYSEGSPAALGNYLAAKIIEFGLQDGSMEAQGYSNEFYQPTNTPMDPRIPGSQSISDPNRWQPLSFDSFIDQSGFIIYDQVPKFLSPEWGFVTPFSLTSDDLTISSRSGNEYWVYLDPGSPVFCDPANPENSGDYIWCHSMVSIWSSHLDPADGVMWDISPGGIGNIPFEDLPATSAGLRDFYKVTDGGDPGSGHDLNPVTGEPYEPQIVPRGDYTRVLAEFWADGPDSETPPGHWFTILNYVMDHPEFEPRIEGTGDPVSRLEWEVKAYFALGGAMHDAALAAWSVKGYYDYIRPISAIRYMADQGQATDQNLPGYDPAGIQLVDGYIEVVQAGDTLARLDSANIGKIKLRAWKGPDYIQDPATDVAGVDWILAEDWWPYQRPTFVTPPFAGYVSGHSTFSRSAAELLTRITGSRFFPGGMGEFHAPKNEFLVFEDGPSVDVTLQWATYQDASDQCSLSRIWGGIHPPIDDIRGRIMGEQIGNQAFELANQYFTSTILGTERKTLYTTLIPNPASTSKVFSVPNYKEAHFIDLQGRVVALFRNDHEITTPKNPGIYMLVLHQENGPKIQKVLIER